MDLAQRPFSNKWVAVSMAAFIAAELAIGGLLGELLLGKAVSINTNFLLQGLFNLAGFAVGGFAIGVISPGRRIVEPAVGAAATMVLISILALFVPFRYIGYSNSGILFASAFAAAIAGCGAYTGEKVTGNAGELTR
jgi:hypothetical protein